MNEIETEKLNIGYRHDLIRDIYLKVLPGQIVTLIGPNGSGKSTLLKTLSLELKARGGVVFLDGKDIRKLKASDLAKRLSIVMTLKLKPELMTCREVVETGRYPYTGSLGILSDEDRARVREAMEETETADIADSLFNNVSDGQRQRVLLARAFAQEPEILILDEPTSYLDIRHKIDILQRIRAYAVEKNAAVIMSLHELEAAGQVSDILVAIGDGRIQKTGTPEEVLKEDFIRKLYDIEGMDISLLGSLPWMKERETVPEPMEAERVFKTAYDGSAAGSESSGSPSDHRPQRKPGVIMIQGTMSNAGKSVIAAGLCRILSDMGFRVMPFKSQNMALNSYVTREGLEMGRAQVMQAECARTEPEAEMNPILLKPVKDTGSQVIVMGQVFKNMSAGEYYAYKKDLIPRVLEAFDRLSKKADVVVIEGAGSPVELNLGRDDFVNMGLAKLTGASVILVGDIDRGGIFAQLYGTMELLTPDERERICGIIVNKFRGDLSLFEDGIGIIEEKCQRKVLGVVPFLDLKLDDEDSLSERLKGGGEGTFEIAVIRLPHMANFTDLDTFEQIKDVSVRYVFEASKLGDPDLIIIPGSKNTIGDLRQMKERGLGEKIAQKAGSGTCVFGICGGYQMLGRSIEDPFAAEGGGKEEGLNLLPVRTVFEDRKTCTNGKWHIRGTTGILEGMEGLEAEGYEIHMGTTVPSSDEAGLREFTSEGTGYCRGNVYGTYIHGFFDRKDILTGLVERIAKMRGKTPDLSGVKDYSEFKDAQYDALASELKKCLDMERILEIAGLKK